MKNKYNVIGLMSGTSLDGLDIANVEFRFQKNKWDFNINRATTIRYPGRWLSALSGAHNLSGEALMQLHAAYGGHLGKVCRDFIVSEKLENIDFVASHGHTVFHQPEQGFTFQLGDGNALHANCNIPVICDFRSLDVRLGGQGAPLVPVGDKYLFNDYGVCLNMGGIANLSLQHKGVRIAFDICYCNMGFNYLMNKRGKPYDKNGETASRGTVNKKLLQSLTRIYASLKKRPSLGREFFEKRIQPLLDNTALSIEDKLATCVESAANEIATAATEFHHGSMLCTGGGVYNSFLMSRILEKCEDRISIIIPDDDVVKFKEAMIFGFLGVLRHVGKTNCLKSVTGADRDSSSGIMIGF